jgi:hypothetical protein
MADQTGAAAEPKRKRAKYVVDEQTGISFKVVKESRLSATVAALSAAYLSAAMLFLLWLLLDTWTGRNLILGALGYGKALGTPTFRLMAFVAIGGALGAAVDGMRSLVFWHSERGAYSSRFIWRDLSLPLVGATVGLMTYVAVRGGAGVLNGDFTLDQKGGSPAISAFSVAALAGFSARQVFRWLDAQANRLFSTAKSNQAAVPDLMGLTLDEVKTLLKGWKLTLGAVEDEPDAANVGKVVRQSPAPGTVVTGAAPIDVSLGVAPAAPPLG